MVKKEQEKLQQNMKNTKTTLTKTVSYNKSDNSIYTNRRRIHSKINGESM
jgi:hypothetical protein